MHVFTMLFNRLLLSRKILISSKILESTGLVGPPKRTILTDLQKHWDDQGPHVHLLDAKPPKTVEMTKEHGIRLYQQMHFIRTVEEICANLYGSKLIRGFCHLYIGQEAIAVGVNSLLGPDDSIITSYRCHSWLLIRDPDIAGFFAELLGYSSGICRGKGGSMHLYCKNFYGGNGIVGAHVPLGVGIALKHKYMNSNAVCVTAFGDGAFPQGQVSEAFNIAKLLNLPVIFLVENNLYGMGTASSRSSANDQYYRVSSYIPGIRTNGMDILSVIECTKFALDHVRSGKGPILLEFMTYRYRGHSMSDPGTSYRGRDEIKKVMDERDCIKYLAKLITESNLATNDELQAIKKENKKRAEEELSKAKKGSLPQIEELTADCYTNYSGSIKLPAMLKQVPHKRISKPPEVVD